MANTLSFTTNWNNKLGCNYFTTIRAHNPQKYAPGMEKEVFLKKEPQGKVQIIQVVTIPVIELKDYTCYLDTGYNAEETKKIVKTMYKITDLEKFKVDVILCKKVS